MDPLTGAVALASLAQRGDEYADLVRHLLDVAEKGGKTFALYIRIIRGENVTVQELAEAIKDRRESDDKLHGLLDSIAAGKPIKVTGS